MKTDRIRNAFLPLVSIGLGTIISFVGCKKSDVELKDIVDKKSNETINDYLNDLGKISKLGFDPFSVDVTPSGYIVEGDILLTKENLNKSFAKLSSQQGQYSTKYSLNLERKIRVGLFISDTKQKTKMKEVLDSCLVEMNSLKIPLNFVFETDESKADIIIKYSDMDADKLGQAAFVNSEGNPGKEILLSSNPASGLSGYSRERLSGIICHEFGHAIGLRHTDYKNRLYSNALVSGYSPTQKNQDYILGLLTKQAVDRHFGAGEWDKMDEARKNANLETVKSWNIEAEEGTLPNDKAYHIYGTPVSPTYGGTEQTDPLSLMLAVTGSAASKKFSLFDNIALFGLYGNPAQTVLIRSSLDEFGNVTAPGKTLKQIVKEAKDLK